MVLPSSLFDFARRGTMGACQINVSIRLLHALHAAVMTIADKKLTIAAIRIA
jgi:hypothetical protein